MSTNDDCNYLLSYCRFFGLIKFEFELALPNSTKNSQVLTFEMKLILYQGLVIDRFLIATDWLNDKNPMHLVVKLIADP